MHVIWNLHGLVEANDLALMSPLPKPAALIGSLPLPAAMMGNEFESLGRGHYRHSFVKKNFAPILG